MMGLQWIFVLLICLFLLTEANQAVENKEETPSGKTEDENCENPDKPRLVTEEELSKYVGKKKGDEVWLAILGEVYNVTKGVDYYTEAAGYHFFSGRDGSVPFITGNFTESETKKSTDVLKPGELYALEQWREFYEKEEKYPYIGLLVGRFYDEEGKPTEEMKKFKERLATYEHPTGRRRRKSPKTATQAKPKESRTSKTTKNTETTKMA